MENKKNNILGSIMPALFVASTIVFTVSAIAAILFFICLVCDPIISLIN